MSACTPTSESRCDCPPGACDSVHAAGQHAPLARSTTEHDRRTDGATERVPSPAPPPTTQRAMRRPAAIALLLVSVYGEDSAPAAADQQTDDSPPAKPSLPGRQRLAHQSASAAAVASYAMTDRCGSAPSGHSTMPMPRSTTAHGVEIVFRDYNITVCNNTAWTFRSLWHGGVAVLTPTGFTQTVTNVNLKKHPCASSRSPSAHGDGGSSSGSNRGGGGGNWTQCSKIFGCPTVGLLEGGAGIAECEAKCASTPNCTAFNLRMIHPGGCSLRNCPPGTLPGGQLRAFAGYADYPIHCDPYTPPGPKPCAETTTALWPPLRPVAQPIIPITPCGAGWGPQPGLPGGGPAQSNDTCSGFLGTGHGGEYVYAVSLHAGGEVINLLNAAPTAGKQWPIASGAGAGGGIGSISIIKESQLGGYLATQNVTLSSDGMTVSANYTLAYDNTLHHVNYFYPSMTMFALPFKSWVAITANGTQLNGTFRSDDSFTLQEPVRWVAVFDPQSLRGAVYQYPVGHAYQGRKGFENSFWNRAYDHKLYLQVNVSKEFGTKKGAQFGFSHTVTGFTATSVAAWVYDAEQLVRWPSSE